MSWQDLLRAFPKTTESLNRVRLGPGVVGRTTTAVVIVLIVLGIVAWNLKDQPIILGGVALLAVLTFLVYFFGVMLFARKYPAAALLEGAEFLEWQQAEWIAKGMLSPPAAPRIVDPKRPEALPPPEPDNA